MTPAGTKAVGEHTARRSAERASEDLARTRVVPERDCDDDIQAHEDHAFQPIAAVGEERVKIRGKTCEQRVGDYGGAAERGDEAWCTAFA